MKKRINFLEVYKLIWQAKNIADIKTSVYTFLIKLKSEIEKIEDDCKLTLKDIDSKGSCNDAIFEKFKSQNISLQILISSIEGFIASETLNKDDQKSLLEVKDCLNKKKELIDKIWQDLRLKNAEDLKKYFGHGFERLYELTELMGGVNVQMSQYFDPLAGGHVNDNNILEESPGICAGLSLEWGHRQTIDGEVRVPLVGEAEVLSKQGEQRTQRKALTRETFTYNSASGNYEEIFNKIGYQPVYVTTDRKNSDSGHAQAFVKRYDGTFAFFDPGSGAAYFPNQDVFIFWFQQYIQFHQAAFFAADNVSFSIFKEDLKQKSEYFPSKAAYVDVSIKFDIEARNKKLLKILKESLIDVEKVIDKKYYNSNEITNIVCRLFRSYLPFFNDKEVVVEALAIIEGMIGDVETESSKVFSKIRQTCRDHIPLKTVLEDLKKEYCTKRDNCKPVYLNDEERAFIQIEKNLKEFLRNKINEALRPDTDQKKYSSIEYDAQTRMLNHKLFLLEKQSIGKKLLASKDSLVSFEYTLNDAKNELDRIVPGYEKIADLISAKEILSDSEIIKIFKGDENSYLNWSVIYVLQLLEAHLSKMLSDPLIGFSGYKVQQDNLKLLKAAHARLVSLNQSFLSKEPKSLSDDVINFRMQFQGVDFAKIFSYQELVTVFKGDLDAIIRDFLQVKFIALTEMQKNSINWFYEKLTSLTNIDDQELREGCALLQHTAKAFFSADNINDEHSYAAFSRLINQVFAAQLFDESGFNAAGFDYLLSNFSAHKKKWQEFLEKIKVNVNEVLQHDPLMATFGIRENLTTLLNSVDKEPGFLKSIQKVDGLLPGASKAFYSGTDSQELVNSYVSKLINKESVKATLKDWVDQLGIVFNGAALSVCKDEKYTSYRKILDHSVEQRKLNLANVFQKANNSIDSQNNIMDINNTLKTFQSDINDLMDSVFLEVLLPRKKPEKKEIISIKSGILCLNSSVKDELQNKIEVGFHHLIESEKFKPLSSAEILTILEEDMLRENKLARGDKITSLFFAFKKPLGEKDRVDFQDIVSKSFERVRDILIAEKTEEKKLKEIADIFKESAKNEKTLRHPLHQVHYETWSNPLLAATAKRVLKMVMMVFSGKIVGVSDFSLNAPRIRIKGIQEKLSTFPKHAAEMISIYNEAMMSEISWQAALYKIEKILMTNYDPDLKQHEENWKDPQGRWLSTQKAYNHAFDLIQDQFHARYRMCKVTQLRQQLLDFSKTISSFDKSSLYGSTVSLVSQALNILYDDKVEETYYDYQVLQWLSHHLYQLVEEDHLNDPLAHKIIHFLAQTNALENAAKPPSDEVSLSRVKTMMQNEQCFFAMRVKPVEKYMQDHLDAPTYHLFVAS